MYVRHDQATRRRACGACYVKHFFIWLLCTSERLVSELRGRLAWKPTYKPGILGNCLPLQVSDTVPLQHMTSQYSTHKHWSATMQAAAHVIIFVLILYVHYHQYCSQNKLDESVAVSIFRPFCFTEVVCTSTSHKRELNLWILFSKPCMSCNSSVQQLVMLFDAYDCDGVRCEFAVHAVSQHQEGL